MDSDLVRLMALSQQMSFEPAEEQNLVGRSDPPSGPDCPESVYIHPAVLPNGQRIKLLKTLLSSACERDCTYCAFRAGRDLRRVSFHPEEFARLFVQLVRAGTAEGVFLSSGVAGGGVRTQDRLLDAADILRHKLGFRGYIHLKVMPGADRSQVERAMRLADRVSINLEAPNRIRLAHLAPHKQFDEELLQPLRWMDEIRRTQPPQRGWNGRWPSSVTQFVAGGSGESDLELLASTQYLYRTLGLKRAYYSRFTPVPGTPLEEHAPTSLVRQNRLYQASYLLRDYGFDLEELPFGVDGLLPVQQDPKLAWARQHLIEQPVEVNRVDRHTLLRIPGIGLKNAEAILRLRRQETIRDLSMLKKLGIPVERAAPFLLLDGRRPAFQPSLW